MLTDKFSFGCNLKGIREDYTYGSSNNFAIDVGTFYNTGWKSLRLGMVMQNFGPEMKPSGTYRNWQGGTYIDPSTGEEMINDLIVGYIEPVDDDLNIYGNSKINKIISKLYPDKYGSKWKLN